MKYTKSHRAYVITQETSYYRLIITRSSFINDVLAYNNERCVKLDEFRSIYNDIFHA